MCLEALSEGYSRGYHYLIREEYFNGLKFTNTCSLHQVYEIHCLWALKASNGSTSIGKIAANRLDFEFDLYDRKLPKALILRGYFLDTWNLWVWGCLVMDYLFCFKKERCGIFLDAIENCVEGKLSWIIVWGVVVNSSHSSIVIFYFINDKLFYLWIFFML